MNPHPQSFADLIGLLGNDITTCINLIKLHGPSDYLHRSLVRTVFSYVDATLFTMRQTAKEYHEDYACTLLAQAGPDHKLPTLKKHFRRVLSAEELCVLREVVPRVDSRGGVSSTPLFINQRDAVRFTFAAFGKACGLDVTPDYADHRWNLFQKSIEIRNRITHPKSEADMSITDDEIACVLQAFAWFQAAVNEARTKNTELMQTVTKELNEFNRACEDGVVVS